MRPEKLLDFSKNTRNFLANRQWFDNLWKPWGGASHSCTGRELPVSPSMVWQPVKKPWGGASHSCERPKLPLRLPLFGPAEQALWYGQVIRTNGTIRRIRARESTVLVSTCCVDYRYRSFPLCVAWWGARGESGLRNFERLPSQVFSYFQIWTVLQDLSWNKRNIIKKRRKEY